MKINVRSHVTNKFVPGVLAADPSPAIMSFKWPQPLDDANSPIPSTWALTFSDAVAQYAQELWAVELQLPNAPEPVWDKTVIDAETCFEVRHLVSAFARALKNQCEYW